MQIKSAFTIIGLLFVFNESFSQKAQFYHNSIKSSSTERLWLYPDSTYKYITFSPKFHHFSSGRWKFDSNDSTIKLNSAYQDEKCLDCYESKFIPSKTASDSLSLWIGLDFDWVLDSLQRKTQDSELNDPNDLLPNLLRLKHHIFGPEDYPTINKIITHQGSKNELTKTNSKGYLTISKPSRIDSLTILYLGTEIVVKNISRYSGGLLKIEINSDGILDSRRFFSDYRFFINEKWKLQKESILTSHFTALHLVE